MTTSSVQADCGATRAVVRGHRDVSLEMMRSYIETGDGCYWTVRAIAWSPDGRYWASEGADDTLRIWDVETGRQIRKYEWNHRWSDVLDMVWSPDGRYVGVLAMGSAGCQAIVVDAFGGEEVHREAGSPDTQLVWPMAPAGGAVSPATVAVRARDPVRDWSPDGRYVAVIGDAKHQESERGTDVAAPPDATSRERPVGGTGNGRRMTKGTVQVVDRASGRVVLNLPHGTSWIAWSPVDRRIASARGRSVAVWEADTGALLCTYRRHIGWFTHVTCLSWEPSGRYMASGDSEGVIHIWQVRPEA